MYVIIGLGNPGKKYDYTRHNIGFDVIDYLSKKHGISVDRLKHKALVGEGRINGKRVMLVKPQTFMNLSGQALMSIIDYYKSQSDQVIVIYDDIDTELGKLRIRKKGSGGSHNGMRNIIYLWKNEDFPRVRIGIGKPKPGYDLADYVLGRFSKDEVDLVAPVIVRAAEAVEDWIVSDIDQVMNKYNG
ncbi:MAG: aminoacyl-tRNA hydrolase [Clostridia bacterium]|nr:aminoacyl-tRNA hydrolase [Clostridia bacterium]